MSKSNKIVRAMANERSSSEFLEEQLLSHIKIQKLNIARTDLPDSMDEGMSEFILWLNNEWGLETESSCNGEPHKVPCRDCDDYRSGGTAFVTFKSSTNIYDNYMTYIRIVQLARKIDMSAEIRLLSRMMQSGHYSYIQTLPDGTEKEMDSFKIEKPHTSEIIVMRFDPAWLEWMNRDMFADGWENAVIPEPEKI